MTNAKVASKNSKSSETDTENQEPIVQLTFPLTIVDIKASKSVRRNYNLRENVLALLAEMHNRENTLDVFSETRAIEQLILDRAVSVGLIVKADIGLSEADKLSAINYGIQCKVNELQLTLRNYVDYVNNHMYTLGNIQQLANTDNYETPEEDKRIRASM